MKNPKNLIIRMPNWIGDFVMATALISDIREAFPRAEITLMCQKPLEQLVLKDTRIHGVLSFEKNSLKIRRREARKNVVGVIAQGGYDVGLLLTHSFSSAWLFFQANIPIRIGYTGDMRSFLLTQSLSRDKAIHQVDYYRKLLPLMGGNLGKNLPSLQVTAEEKNQMQKELLKRGVTDKHYLILVNPSAAYGPAKCWPKEKFRRVIQTLLQDPLVAVFIIGDKAGFQDAETILQGMRTKAHNLCGKTTLRQLASLMQVANLLLTNDSGPMHMADALALDVVAVFGSTDPKKTGPYSQPEHVLYRKVDCSPCYKRVCPIDFRCMESISVDHVLQTIQAIKRHHVQKVPSKMHT